MRHIIPHPGDCVARWNYLIGTPRCSRTHVELDWARPEELGDFLSVNAEGIYQLPAVADLTRRGTRWSWYATRPGTMPFLLWNAPWLLADEEAAELSLEEGLFPCWPCVNVLEVPGEVSRRESLGASSPSSLRTAHPPVIPQTDLCYAIDPELTFLSLEGRRGGSEPLCKDHRCALAG